MVDGEGECDKDWQGSKYYYDMGHHWQGGLRDRGGRAMAWTVYWPLGRGTGWGEGIKGLIAGGSFRARWEYTEPTV